MVSEFDQQMTNLPATIDAPGTEIDAPACNTITLPELQLRLLQLAPAAIETLKNLLDNPAKGQTRLNAAKTILDRIGLIPPKASDPVRRKGLEDMTRDELHELIRHSERVLGDRATPVAPVPERHVSDILD